VIVLDTDVLSALRRPERHPRVAARLMAQDASALFISAITIGEIARGVALEARRNPEAGAVLGDWLDPTCLQFADRVVPFDDAAARAWGRLSAEIGHDGADLQIAATALVGGFTVATRNTRPYAPTGVALIDPFEG
jgi:predicted nucleic acid-binding protein